MRISSQSKTSLNIDIHNLAVHLKNDTLRKTALARTRMSLASENLSFSTFSTLVKNVFDPRTCEAMDKRAYLRTLLVSTGVYRHAAWSKETGIRTDYERMTDESTEYSRRLRDALGDEMVFFVTQGKIPAGVEARVKRAEKRKREADESDGKPTRDSWLFQKDRGKRRRLRREAQERSA